MAQRLVALVASSALLFTAPACDSYPDAPPLTTSMEPANLKGTVRVDGKPVNNGTVSFRTAHVRRPNSPTKVVDIAKDGSYSVTTVVGENYVEVSCNEMKAKKAASRRFLGQEQLIMVESGDHTVDIDIPPAK